MGCGLHEAHGSLTGLAVAPSEKAIMIYGQTIRTGDWVRPRRGVEERDNPTPIMHHY